MLLVFGVRPPAMSVSSAPHGAPARALHGTLRLAVADVHNIPRRPPPAGRGLSISSHFRELE